MDEEAKLGDYQTFLKELEQSGFTEQTEWQALKEEQKKAIGIYAYFRAIQTLLLRENVNQELTERRMQKFRIKTIQVEQALISAVKLAPDFDYSKLMITADHLGFLQNLYKTLSEIEEA